VGSPVSIFPFRSSPSCESCGAAFPHSLTRHTVPRRSFGSCSPHFFRAILVPSVSTIVLDPNNHRELTVPHVFRFGAACEYSLVIGDAHIVIQRRAKDIT
jgi:hypothetical protein